MKSPIIAFSAPHVEIKVAYYLKDYKISTVYNWFAEFRRDRERDASRC